MIRNGAGVIDLSARGKLRVTGKDRIALLHGITTQDVKSLHPGEGAWNTSVTDIGRLIADFRMLVRADDVLLDMLPSLTEKTRDWLDRYVITEDVQFDDVTARYAMLGVHGPHSAEVLSGFRLPEKEHHFTENEGILVVAARWTGETGYDLWMPAAQKAALWERFVQAGAEPFDEATACVLRMEAGVPTYGVDMDEENNPLEAALASAVSLDKGCYMGQEVLARLTFRAGPVRVLMGIRTPDGTLLSPGDHLFANGKDIGWITSSTQSPALGIPIALGYVRREQKQPGTPLLAHHDGREVPAEVVALPWLGRVFTP
ncbi:MAG: CAF17-like 4Fe-4S cluster assembly/insertion protein YgfZ [Candidatus Xenobia bacterium]